jgi:hypothetical protein
MPTNSLDHRPLELFLRSHMKSANRPRSSAALQHKIHDTCTAISPATLRSAHSRLWPLFPCVSSNTDTSFNTYCNERTKALWCAIYVHVCFSGLATFCHTAMWFLYVDIKMQWFLSPFMFIVVSLSPTLQLPFTLETHPAFASCHLGNIVTNVSCWYAMNVAS